MRLAVVTFPVEDLCTHTPSPDVAAVNSLSEMFGDRAIADLKFLQSPYLRIFSNLHDENLWG